MKLNLQKARLILLLLTFTFWTTFVISAVAYGWSYVNWQVVPFIFGGSVLLIFNRKKFDLISLVLYLYGVIWTTHNYIYHCEIFNHTTFNSCRDFVLWQLSMDRLAIVWLILSVITIGFLTLNLFRKQNSEFK